MLRIPKNPSTAEPSFADDCLPTAIWRRAERKSANKCDLLRRIARKKPTVVGTTRSARMTDFLAPDTPIGLTMVDPDNVNTDHAVTIFTGVFGCVLATVVESNGAVLVDWLLVDKIIAAPRRDAKEMAIARLLVACRDGTSQQQRPAPGVNPSDLNIC
jgi:hypothetical protein